MPGVCPPACLVQPGRQELLDVAAAARTCEPAPDRLSFHDYERRHLVHGEPLEQVRPFLLRDAENLEGAVVSTALENLGQEALHPAAVPGQARVEEDEARFLLGISY